MRSACLLLALTALVVPALHAQPTVVTNPQVAATSFQAQLSGTVNPGGEPTTVWFRYGVDSNLNSSLSTLFADLGAGTKQVTFYAKIIGLTGNTTYYYQAYATNATGTGKGAIASFTTPATPVLSLGVKDSGNFAQGQNGATYTLTVSNDPAAGPTSDSVGVTQTLPAGLTLVSIGGQNWSCQQNTCQRNDLLAPGDSYPPINVVVNVAPDAPAQVTYKATVSGPGVQPFTATDVTTIKPLTGEAQFINTLSAAIAAESESLSATVRPLVLGGNLALANGAMIAGVRQDVLLDYVDGLKAAGVQRVDLNPGILSMNDPNATALYDAVVQHIRQLGLELALNPEVNTGDLGSKPKFQDFQNTALQTYPQLAARYQPDEFVIVHMPTTMAARMGIQTAPSDWDGFIRAVAPLIKSASPHTRLGAGDFYSQTETAFYQDFLGIPDLDFLTMEIFDDANFEGYTQWAMEAHTAADAAHPNGKGVYIDQTWAPYYLPTPLPANWQAQPMDSLALVGPANSDFAATDASWLQMIAQFASDNGMEAVTAYTTEAFFAYGTANADKLSEPAYSAAAQQAVLQGQLTGTGQGYRADSQKFAVPQAVSLSSASYATLPTVFNPTCGTGSNPCNANATVAPDMLVAAFGADLAIDRASANSATFPVTLAGSTLKLIDSSNTSFDVGMYFASPGQVNYLVPSNAAPGPAGITVTSSDGTQTGGTLLIAPVAPGLYTASQTGSGPAAGIAICAGTCSGWPNSQGNGQFYQYTFASGCVPGSCSPQPLSLGGASDQVVVELFGTGIRHVSSLAAVTASINGQNVPVIYAGPQGQYPGLDQINVLLPHGLSGSGTVNLVLSVQDSVNNVNASANAVTLNIM